MDYRIQELLSHLNANLSNHTSLEEMAERTGVSVSRLQHLFKAEVGTSVTQYLCEKRLQMVSQLLETTHLAIKTIYYQTGVLDEKAFLRNFKKKFGMTPTEYRKNHRHSRKGK
jgi:AraC family transcriptional regulator of arabinose operon